MFAVIFICENLFFADRRETGKIKTRKTSHHTVYQTKQLFKIHNLLQIVHSFLFCI